MWAVVGHHVPAVGPYGILVVLLVPIIAVLGTIGIILMVSKNRIPEGDIRIRILGIKVRWGNPEIENSKPPDSSHASPDEKEGKESRLHVVDSEE